MALHVALFRTPDFLPRVQAPWDKAVHFAVFYVLALIGNSAWSGKGRGWVLAFLLAFASISEILQGLPIFGRDAQWGDWTANLLGIGAASAPLWLERRSAQG